MLRPLNNRALIKPEAKANKTESGFLLADKGLEKPVIGEVIVGNSLCNEGDRVVFSRFGYDEIELKGEIHYIVSDKCILGVLN